MNTTFTLNDLIRFAYNETDFLETTLILRAFDNDYHLKKMYDEFLAILKCLDGYEIEPSQKSIDAILDYSIELTQKKF